MYITAVCVLFFIKTLVFISIKMIIMMIIIIIIIIILYLKYGVQKSGLRQNFAKIAKILLLSQKNMKTNPAKL